MGKKDPRVTAYIAKAQPFARPILTRLRGIVHEACPRCEETIKWGMPTFLYEGMLCGMAAFRAHATFGFWKGSLVVDAQGGKAEDAMGQFGRITSLGDLPPRRELVGYVKKAMKLNEDGVRPARAKAAKAAGIVPADLKAALAKNRKAAAVFAAFAPSHRREYVEWIVEAKRPETRARRLVTAIEWLTAGKKHNWKYEKC